MTSKRTYFVLLGLIVLLVVGIVGGAYGLNHVLEAKSDKLVGLKTKQQALAQEQVQLKQMKKDIVTYNGLYQISQVIVPQSKDQTETVRQIVNLAKQNDIILQSITFPASSLGTGTNPQAISSGPTAPGTTSAAPSGTAVSSNPTLSQLEPIAHIPGVYDLQVEVASATDPDFLATYPELISFLSSLEQNRLTAQVSSIDIQPNEANRSHLSFTLNLNIFIKP